MATPASPGAVKPGQDEQRVCQRSRCMSKEALVACLMATEQTMAEQRERGLSQQDEVPTWHLRAETVETRLQQRQARADQQEQQPVSLRHEGEQRR
jgi:hypothetical protein